MKKHLIVFFILAILISGLYPIFAQETQKIPADFFSGKWQGSIQYDVKLFDNKGRITSHHTSSLKNINIVAEEFNDDDATSAEILTNFGFDNYTAGWMSKMRNPFSGNAVYTSFSQFYDNRGMLGDTWELKNGTENIEISGRFYSNNRIWICGEGYIEIKRGPFFEEHTTFSFGAATWSLLILEGMDFEINDNKLIINYKGKPAEGGNINDYIKITGELCKVYVKKDTLGKTVQINEPIKTDEYTQRDIAIPAVPEMPDFPYKIGDLIVAGNTECVFTSENELYLISGEVISFVDKNWWESVDLDKVVSNEYEISDIEMGELITKVEKLREEGHDFKVRSPQGVIAVRGTQFITKVEKDGATTLTVLDGEVEFSDMEKRKTVLVKKNQRSTINPGGLPTEPEAIEQNQILKWWK